MATLRTPSRLPWARPVPRLDTDRDGDPRVLLVTGAASGIGRSVARLSATVGDHVVLLGRHEGALREVARECEAAGAASVTVLPTDIGGDAQVKAAVARTLERHGRIDVAVNSAGLVAYGRLEEVPSEVFDSVLRTNINGTVNLARHVLPVMRAQGHGALVLVGSVVGHMAVPGMAAYAVSKWAVRSVARQLQLENRDLADLSISYVSPGGVLTPIYEQAANYSGYVGRPPPPVYHPDQVARVILERVERPRKRTQVGFANDVLRLGFSLAPGLYDVLVGPLATLATKDLTRPVEPHPGNVLGPSPRGEHLLGDQAGPWRAVARNARIRLRARLFERSR